jgi:8-oxo-dGTP pyrophosphatase MutT (NUDIX family)
MAGEVIAVYPGQHPPESWDACMLVGGPAARSSFSASPGQSEVIALLRDRWTTDGRLVIFVPKPGNDSSSASGEVFDWHGRALDVADVLMFWWPDDTDACLMPTSLMAWNDSQRAVHGTPPDGPHSQYLFRYAEVHAISTATTPSGLVSVALQKIGSGERRTGGERDVPLPIWRTDSFQRWYSAQTSAGNTLLGARQVWTFNTGVRQQNLLYWALHVRVYVQAERRIKSNEVVISRPDISVMALFRRGNTIDDTTIVLIREFRSPGSTPDGLVHELPGGSAVGETRPLDDAARETEEETGLAINLQRIRTHGSRQLAAAVSAHHAHLFTAEITGDELAQLRSTLSTSYGAGDTEKTWIEITTFREILGKRVVDWATLGMITQALLDREVPPPAIHEKVIPRTDIC